jgi:hypothetical protein
MSCKSGNTNKTNPALYTVYEGGRRGGSPIIPYLTFVTDRNIIFVTNDMENMPWLKSKFLKLIQGVVSFFPLPFEGNLY